ncbi:MAG: hypothetical protein IJ736_07310, partial [Firmicutes bacterium]|nr:hypothetical protein [Bacillota bacterium]
TTGLSSTTIPAMSPVKDESDNIIGYKYTYNVKSAADDTLTGLTTNKIVEGTGKVNADDGYIKFTTNGKTSVSVSGDSKCNKLTIQQGDSVSTSSENAFTTVASDNKSVSISDLTSGTYTIGRIAGQGGNAYIETLEITVYNTTDNAQTQSYFTPYKIITKDGASYVIGKISADDVANVTGNVGLAGSATKATAVAKSVPNNSTGTVYKEIKVGETTIAGDANGTDYYYAVKLDKVLSGEYYVKAFADDIGTSVDTAVTIQAAE